jgi:hypothetical protein
MSAWTEFLAGVQAYFRRTPAAPAAAPQEPTVAHARLAWGAKVSMAFGTRVIALGAEHGCDPSYFMAGMAFESAGTFSPSVRNPVSQFVGLIQFGPAAAAALGTTLDALGAMTAEEQLEYVAGYFAPYRGRLRSLSDVYMAILWPRAIGKPDSEVIFGAGSNAYLQNRGLDLDHNGAVTKAEAASLVNQRLIEGLKPINAVPF